MLHVRWVAHVSAGCQCGDVILRYEYVLRVVGAQLVAVWLVQGFLRLRAVILLYGSSRLRLLGFMGSHQVILGGC
jgi:hypothetical protein